MEKRLIDANAMRDDWLENGENEYVYDTNAVLASIDEQPTIDAVQVVRCRECVFRGQHDLCPMNVRVYMLDEAAYLDCTEDDGFCHKGEKMDAQDMDGPTKDGGTEDE